MSATISCFCSPGDRNLATDAGNDGQVHWEFTGQYHAPVDEALPAPVHETTLPAQVELARLRLDDYSAVVAAASFTQGNDVQPRPDVNSSDGYNGLRIVGRAPSGGGPRRRPRLLGSMATGRRMPFQMRVGTVPGNPVWMLAPVTQYTGLTYRDRTGLRTYDAGLKVAQYAGDDETIFASSERAPVSYACVGATSAGLLPTVFAASDPMGLSY